MEKVKGILVYVPYVQLYACLSTTSGKPEFEFIYNGDCALVTADCRVWYEVQFVRTGGKACPTWHLIGEYPFGIDSIRSCMLAKRR